MELKEICKRICDFSSSESKKIDSPMAYVRVRVGKDFLFGDEEFQQAFHDAKWDTEISSADIDIIRDDSFLGFLKIEELTGFFDEDGKCAVIRTDGEGSQIAL